MARLLIVDDHEIARRGIRQVAAEGIPDAEFGEAATEGEALERLAGGGWELVLLDLNLPGRGGLDLLAELRRRWPRLRVLVVSAYPEDEFALRCMRLGADGYVTKTSGARELLTALRKVLGGERYVTEALAQRLAGSAGQLGVRSANDLLTTRELQVLRAVAAGRSIKQIAAELHLAEGTVATYRLRIGRKLGLSSNVDLARYALRNALAD